MKKLLYYSIPKPLIAMGIHLLLRQRLKQCEQQVQKNADYKQQFIESLRQAPIALSTDEANEQHYEVPTSFYQLILGPYLKYSSGLWLKDDDDLASSEVNMLKCYCERLNIKDGDTILDLGCGWGSASLYIAKHYPSSQITAISNSATQGSYITEQAKQQGLANIKHIKMNAKQLNIDQQFDKVISIEMFEHMRNYQQLLQKLRSLLKQDGYLFVHHFCHDHYIYPFDTDEKNSWMAKYFFTDGLMPSADLLDHFQQDFNLINSWKVSGTHYAKTCEAWLKPLQQHKQEIIELFTAQTNKQQARLMWKNWQIFTMACKQLFAYNQGNEWYVVHKLLQAK